MHPDAFGDAELFVLHPLDGLGRLVGLVTGDEFGPAPGNLVPLVQFVGKKGHVPAHAGGSLYKPRHFRKIVLRDGLDEVDIFLEESPRNVAHGPASIHPHRKARILEGLPHAGFRAPPRTAHELPCKTLRAFPPPLCPVAEQALEAVLQVTRRGCILCYPSFLLPILSAQPPDDGTLHLVEERYQPLPVFRPDARVGLDGANDLSHRRPRPYPHRRCQASIPLPRLPAVRQAFRCPAALPLGLCRRNRCPGHWQGTVGPLPER